MPLKFKFKTKDEIPADHLPLYAEREGGWVLDVEGAVDKSKLDEFRHTNVSLLKERDELKKRYEGIDPEEVRQLTEEKRRLEETAQLKAGEVEKVLEARVKSLRALLRIPWGPVFGEKVGRQGATRKDTRSGLRPRSNAASQPFAQNPPGGGAFGCGRHWFGRHSPLRGCSGLAALAAAKIPRRRTPRNL